MCHGDALKIALAADTVSIAVMEIIDNAIMLGVPGAMEAGLTSWLFWASLAFALAVAFVLTVAHTQNAVVAAARDAGASLDVVEIAHAEHGFEVQAYDADARSAVDRAMDWVAATLRR